MSLGQLQPHLHELPGCYLQSNDVKEQLSIAHVHSVATLAGFGTNPIPVDRDSIDLEIIAKGKLEDGSKFKGTKIGIQLKSTSSVVSEGDTFPFRLGIKNYNDLREEVMLPRILVVLLLPPDPRDWGKHTCAGLQLQKCVYWHSLLGAEEKNQKSVTVQISRKNVFSPAALREIMVKASKTEPLI